MRNFELEVYFSKWEFNAQYHMTASDMESMTFQQLLDMASSEDREKLTNLWLGYTETWGAADVRQAIADTYNKSIESENVLCFAGAGEGIYSVMRVLLNKEDHAIVVVPNYQSAETVPLDICQVSGVRLHHQDNWQLNLDDVKAAIRPNTKLISINFPNNPTGSTMPNSDLDVLIELCRESGIYLFSDEVYRGVERASSDTMFQVADRYEKGISLNVLSKAYGLPGLRVGWIASQDKALLQKAERYKHYLSICNSAPSERLAIIALKNQERIFSRNSHVIASNLIELERFFADYHSFFEWVRPKGGCVGYPKYIGPDGVEYFCKSLVEKSGVLLLPSSIYRSELMSAPEEHFRIGFGRIAPFKDGLSAMRTHMETQY